MIYTSHSWIKYDNAFPPFSFMWDDQTEEKKNFTICEAVKAWPNMEKYGSSFGNNKIQNAKQWCKSMK